MSAAAFGSHADVPVQVFALEQHFSRARLLPQFAGVDRVVEGTGTARELAAAVLESGSRWTLAALSDELTESAHPLADHYRWGRAVEGLDLDADAEAELEDLVTAGVGSRSECLARLLANVDANPESPPELVASLRRLSRHR